MYDVFGIMEEFEIFIDVIEKYLICKKKIKNIVN